MPTNKDTLFRLLNLYPVEALKKHWEVQKGKLKNEIISEILKIAKEPEIFTFCHSHQEITKQHLFIFEHEAKSLRSFPNPLLADFIPVEFSRVTDRIEEFYLVPVTYKVVIGPPYRDIELQFLWPISILADSASTILTLTILEKNIDSYLPAGERALNTRRDLDEDSILNLLTDNLPSTVTITRADLNKGVKKLWDSDRIDAPYARYKPDKSTITQTMDRTYLLKKDDPAGYQKAIKEPLIRTLFVVVDPQADYSTRFSVSPSEGELMFNRYGKPEEVANVVRTVLAAN